LGAAKDSVSAKGDPWSKSAYDQRFMEARKILDSSVRIENSERERK
jgi:hypothetical protein